MPQTSTPFSRPNSIWSRFDNYPPAAPPAEILVSTSGFGPGGVSGPYRILMSLCKKPSCCGADCSQGDNFCSAHTLLDEESDWSDALCPEADPSLLDCEFLWSVLAFSWSDEDCPDKELPCPDVRVLSCSIEPVCAWDTLAMPKAMTPASTADRVARFFRMEIRFMMSPYGPAKITAWNTILIYRVFPYMNCPTLDSRRPSTIVLPARIASGIRKKYLEQE